MKSTSKNDKDIRLRKWCLEFATKATGMPDSTEWVIEQAQKLYDWVTSARKESDQKFGMQLRK